MLMNALFFLVVTGYTVRRGTLICTASGLQYICVHAGPDGILEERFTIVKLKLSRLSYNAVEYSMVTSTTVLFHTQ